MSNKLDSLEVIGNRLFQFMEHKRIGVNELGRMTGTSGAQISNIIHGKKYGIDKMINILQHFREVNVYWLLFGEGEMISDEYDLKRKLVNKNELKIKNLINVNDLSEDEKVNELIHKLNESYFECYKLSEMKKSLQEKLKTTKANYEEKIALMEKTIKALEKAS